MQQEYSSNIRPILDCFDKVREILRNEEEIEIPKIVVVGDQSSGKSSVLESVSSIRLPRGQNTVTRCPIIIQMRNAGEDQPEYALIRIEGCLDSRKINLNELYEEISKSQKLLIEKEGVEITETSLHVMLYKKNAPDLTLYDLPGLTYKDENLANRIKKMYEKFTKGKETVILIILPANVDLTTSEAILICKKNPDYQERTIPVITKIDLAVNEKNLYQKIMMNELDLRFDPIIVRNCTQDELDAKENMESIRKKEQALFASVPELIRLPEDSKGIDKLIHKLIVLQRQKLSNCKYELRDKILDKMLDLQEEERGLPPPCNTQGEKIERFKHCLKIYSDRIYALTTEFLMEEDRKMNMPTRIREMFDEHVEEFRRKHALFFSDSYHKKISDITKEARGLRLANFPDERIFQKLMQAEIINTTKNSVKLVEKIKDYVFEILLSECQCAFTEYANLSKAISIELKMEIQNQKDQTMEFISTVIDMETSIQYTLNPYYMDTVTKLTNIIKDKKNTQPTQTTQTTSNSGFLLNSTSMNPNFTNPNFGTISLGSSKAFPKHDNVKTHENVKINDIVLYSDETFTENIINAWSDSDLSIQNIQLSLFAYWKVFEKRFVDYYHMIIQKNLFYYFRDNISLIIERKFSPTWNEQVKEWICENPALTKRRAEIKNSLEAFEEASEELNKIL